MRELIDRVYFVLRVKEARDVRARKWTVRAVDQQLKIGKTNSPLSLLLLLLLLLLCEMRRTVKVVIFIVALLLLLSVFVFFRRWG